MANRKQLPLPDGIAPSRRPVPALPDNDDSPPPPVPSRPRPGKGLPPVPSPSTLPPRQVPRTPSDHMRNSVSSDGDDSDASTESYEDMAGQEPQPPMPNIPKRGYRQEAEKKRLPIPPPAKVKPAPEPEPEPDDQGVYEDGEVGDIYDEAHMGGAEEDEQETYDDMEVGEATDEPQESYDEFGGVAQEPQESYDEFGGIAQDTYEIEEAQEEYQECDVGPAVTEELYQVTDDEPQQTSTKPLPPPPSAPALPPPRPRQREKEDVAVPPPPRDTAAKKQAVVKGQGMPAIGMGDIQNIKNQLKKVGVAPKPQPKTEPKVYTDSSELKQKFNFFKQKEQEALARGIKPEITPKPKGLGLKKSTSLPEDQTDTAVLPARPGDKPKLQHRNTSDSLPPLPSPRDDNLPPPPPPAKSETSPQQRDLPPPPVSTPPQPPPPRGKDGYTKVNVNEEQNNTHNEESDDEPQDIYDDAISFEDPLSRESWYFGEIDRMVGNEKLKKLNQNGAYLLRKSTKGGDKQPYTLMVIYKGHVYNLKIRERNDGRVALGEDRPDEMSFKSVADLIKHHQNNDVILVHRDGKQDSTLLLKSPPK